MNVFSDTLSQQSSNGDVGAELDLLTMFSDLDKDVTELDQELASKEEDSKIGDWEFISQLLENFRLMNASLNLTAVLEHVIDAAIAVIQAERGFLMLKNTKGGLQFKVARDSQRNNLTDKEFQISSSFLQQAVESKKMAYIEDALTDEAYSPTLSVQTLKLRSVVCCPLLVKDELVGVIYADSSKPLIGRSQIKSQLFQVFADQAAVAIRNAQLYQKVKTSYDKLQNAHERLIYAEKMTARGKMAARIGHELNNLLAGIYGNLELSIKFIEADEDKEMVLKRLNKVDNMLESISRFSQGLMSNSHLETKLTKADLNSLVHEFIEFIRPVYDKSEITFEEDFDENIPELRVDKGQIQQILYNLVTNAIDVKPDTHISITTQYDEESKVVKLCVTDTGPGIEKEKQKRIFVPLFSDKAGGHGYGLAISQEIAKTHGGTLSVESQLGYGATFTLSLPLFEEK